MEVLFVVLPIALLIAAGAVWAFVWSVRSGQMDDLDSPPVRMLFDDDGAGPRGRAPKASPRR